MTRHTPFGLYGTGFLFIVLGIVAIVEPLVAGLAMTMVLGWLFMIGGVVHGIGAVDAEDFGRALLRVAVGLAYVLTGLYLLTHPVIALGTLTLVLGAVLFIQAILEFTVYLLFSDEGDGWVAVNATITLVLSAMILWRWPAASMWAIGTLVGVNLMVTGLSHLLVDGAIQVRDRSARA